MKYLKNLLLMSVGILFSGISFGQSTEITDSVWVNGNCGMCEKTIEKSALNAGAGTASWDKETKYLTVSFNPSKTNTTTIQKAVAESGYDTKEFRASEKAYLGLEKCCQYARKDDLPVKKE